jgi:hypothetical protein
MDRHEGRRRLTYANVISTVALFVALGGGAYAASGGSSPGTVTLCVGRGGSVRVTAKCGKGTRKVLVNQRGIQGPPGQPGTPGSVTAYSAGTGLSLSGTTFSANLSALQARIAGSGCATDQAIQSISQDGTATCTSLHAYAAPPITPEEGETANTAVAVPAGTWAVLAQGKIVNGDGAQIDFNCQLESKNTVIDSVDQYVDNGASATLSPITTTTTTGPSTVLTILCTDESGRSRSEFADLSLVAIPVAALN